MVFFLASHVTPSDIIHSMVYPLMNILAHESTRCYFFQTLLIVNSSKILKQILLIFAVKIAEYCTFLSGVVLMKNQWYLFHTNL